MITIKELVETYLRANGLKRINGSDEDASPLLPLIIMDSAFQLYCKHVRPIKCRQEMKKIKNAWFASYEAFNKDYFRCYNQDQTEYICDMMDAFGTYIENDLAIAFVQFTNLFKSEDVERQKVIAACMLSNVLCQCAELIWERVYAAAYRKQNKEIIACEKYMHQWVDRYYGVKSRLVNPNESKPLCDAIDMLCRKQVEFLRLYI